MNRQSVIADWLFLMICACSVSLAANAAETRIEVPEESGLDVYIDGVNSEPIAVIQHFFGNSISATRLDAISALRDYEYPRAKRIAREATRRRFAGEILELLNAKQRDDFQQLLKLRSEYATKREAVISKFERTFRGLGGQGSFLDMPPKQSDLFELYGLPKDLVTQLNELSRKNRRDFYSEFAQRLRSHPKPKSQQADAVREYQATLKHLRDAVEKKFRKQLVAAQNKLLTVDQRAFRDEIEPIRATTYRHLEELNEVYAAQILKTGRKPSTLYWKNKIDDSIALASTFLSPNEDQKKELLDLRFRFPREVELAARLETAKALRPHLKDPSLQELDALVSILTSSERKTLAVWKEFRQTFNPRARLPYGLIPRNMSAIGVVDDAVLAPAPSGGKRGTVVARSIVEQELQRQGWTKRPGKEDVDQYNKFAESHRRTTFQLNRKIAIAVRRLFLSEDWFPKSLKPQYEQLADIYDAAHSESIKLRIQRAQQIKQLLGAEYLRKLQADETPIAPDPPSLLPK